MGIDNQLTLEDGRRGLEGYLMPQIAYHVSPVWLLAMGEQIMFQQGGAQPQWATWMMVEREF